MLDFDASKLVLIGIVALIFIGPKELPRVLRQVGQVVGKMRRMAAEFQGQFMDAMKEADLENVRQDLTKVVDHGKFPLSFNPIQDIKNEITSAITTKQTSPSQPEAEPATPPLAIEPPAPAPAVVIAPPVEPAPIPVLRKIRPRPAKAERVNGYAPRTRIVRRKSNGVAEATMPAEAAPVAPVEAER